tara:strand:+ start:12267 stop:13595 length:1329 start_codon:yes stop_codon:yes gene_type:complete
MNSVVIAITLMLFLSVVRVNIIIALTVSSIVAGLLSHLPINETIAIFNQGLGHHAKLALGYATLGAFAVALSHSGITDMISSAIIRNLGSKHTPKRKNFVKYMLILSILIMSIFSQNLIPIHIAFIPILIPPLLAAMNMLSIDRRLIACVISFGLVTTYMILPLGYGHMFLNDILCKQLNLNGLAVYSADVIKAMALPATGMFIGLLIASLISYRKPRAYQITADVIDPAQHQEIHLPHVYSALFAIGVTVAVQIIYQDAMIMAALAGYIILHFCGVLKRHNNEDIMTQGFNMMAMIGFIMITASGFAEVIKATGEIESLVAAVQDLIGVDHRGFIAFLMLFVGLLITMGIGSSFSTIPIIASIYVPLAMSFGFSPLATIALVGTAAALGDAGSPVSEATMGVTAGLNTDKQHDHIYDSVIPTFIHFNLPLIIFGWIAAMVL